MLFVAIVVAVAEVVGLTWLVVGVHAARRRLRALDDDSMRAVVRSVRVVPEPRGRLRYVVTTYGLKPSPAGGEGRPSQSSSDVPTDDGSDGETGHEVVAFIASDRQHGGVGVFAIDELNRGYDFDEIVAGLKHASLLHEARLTPEQYTIARALAGQRALRYHVRRELRAVALIPWPAVVMAAVGLIGGAVLNVIGAWPKEACGADCLAAIQQQVGEHLESGAGLSGRGAEPGIGSGENR